MQSKPIFRLFCLLLCLSMVCTTALAEAPTSVPLITLRLVEPTNTPSAEGMPPEEAPPTETAATEGCIRMISGADEPSFFGLDKSLQVFCVPVGAQDCYLIRCEGHAMMLDCAAIGRDPVPDFLLRLLEGLGIERFDYVLNTHPHRDHCEGFPELLAKVPAGEFLTVFPPTYDWRQKYLLRDVGALGVPVRQYVEGEPLELGSAVIHTYRFHKSKNTNDISLVVHIAYGERSILLTADIGPTPQRKMAVEYGDEWRADILKLPHHGIGQLAPELYDAVKPELCFVSNGETAKAIDRMRKFLERRDTPLLYTSRALLTDGQVWQAQQWPDNAIRLPGYAYDPPADEAATRD